VALVQRGEELSEVVSTTVRFRELSDADIEAYVVSGEWEDRAGAYAVQGLGASLVDRVEGDLSNVIGLPIPTVCRMIASLQNRK
jgi:septum formation protein